jgi:putative hydrolase of the HAD superfamily
VTAIRAVISDFGGVMTSPLEPAMLQIWQRAGLSMTDLGMALAALTAAHGANPLWEMESGRMTEPDFLRALGEEVSARVGRTVSFDGLGDSFFAELEVNAPFVAYLRGLRDRGYRMGLCTNNVREWETQWRAMVPLEEIFDVVIDSSAIGARKPEPRIYELTLEGLGVPAEEAVFIDDLEVNCTGAAQLGLHPVWFRDSEQAIADTEALLRDAA